jgi:hypothetical protein
MDHNEALQLQAAVKYVLGELSQSQREAYEEHYFDCPECALDLKAAALFVDSAREVLRQEARNEASKVAVPAAGGWFIWLKPIFAVPAFAVLLLALGYQNFVSIPRYKNAAMQAAAPRVLPMFSLIAANTRSADSQAFQVRPGERFGLYLDVPTDAVYSSYLLRLEDPSGQSAILSTVSSAQAQKTQVVEVNPGSRSGAYQLVVLGLTAQNADPVKAPILATIKFNVEFTR